MTTRYVEHVMGMPITLALRGPRERGSAAQTVWRDVMSSLRAADKTFSTFRLDSWISRLVRGEVSVQECPADVQEVLELGERARIESNGAFDIRYAGTIDPSGVVKGWAVERAARYLEGFGADYCLSAGGDMVCWSDDDPWRIGIENPFAPDKVMAVVPIRAGAVATSGTVHRGAHIRDPRTRDAPAGLSSVTVIGPSLTWADIDATAAYAQGFEAAQWLQTRPGRTAFIVWEDGSTETVSGPADDARG